MRNWLDLLCFLLSGLPANGTIAAEVRLCLKEHVFMYKHALAQRHGVIVSCDCSVLDSATQQRATTPDGLGQEACMCSGRCLCSCLVSTA